jgi:methionyl-tRNA formyltransferase
MRIVFMGTPEWALPTLRVLVESGNPVVGVFSQPDRPVGRKQILKPSPVREWAESQGLPVWTPEQANSPKTQETLSDLKPEVVIVCAYGQLLPQAVLDLPRLGCFNLHFSLLPRWRGASPVQAAILAGDQTTGVVLQKMVLRLDAGALLCVSDSVPITPEDTSETLGAHLAELGAKLVQGTLPRFAADALALIPQDESAVTHCRIIRKSQGGINWRNESAEQIKRKQRAYTPWPGIHCFTSEGKRLQLVQVKVVPGSFEPGQVYPELLIGTRAGGLRILQLKPEGRRVMTAEAFLQGHSELVGELLP